MEAAYVVVLPVKPPARGKSRLAHVSDERRRELAEAFALDTATACLAATSVAHVLVVTDDAVLAGRLGAIGCATVPDAGDGLNGALRQAAAEAGRRWPALQPVALLADLPALLASDLDTALGALVPGGASYVVDADGTGTTLYTAPYDEFDPAFGVDSAHGQPAGDLATLRRDVDDLDDLRAAAALGLGAETSRAASGLL